jgi:pimeloyl-ACP methyl ester carboxylesterase
VEPTHTFRLPDGRLLAVDDVGDPAGLPVVYLHGTPDSRLARHPDDGVAAACGVRLLAVDRPGAGDSDPHPDGGLRAIGHDVAHVLDELGVDGAGLLGWSAGGLFALAAAAVLGRRAMRAVLVGTLPPVEAYRDDALVAALGPRRRPFVELAAELPAAELAAEVAPYLVPEPLTPDAAADHVLEGAGARGRAELTAVPGALEQLMAALAASVAQGVDGLARDVALQLEPGLDLSLVTAEVVTVHGDGDEVSPPAVGRWLADRLPRGRVDVVPEAGHHLLFPRWADLLCVASGQRDDLR